MTALHSIEVKNFRSLESVRVELGPLNVLVGPNAAGKSNLLAAIGFLGDVARTDLQPAIALHGGASSILFRGIRNKSRKMSIRVVGEITEHSSISATDEYAIEIGWGKGTYRATGASVDIVVRTEELKFKRNKGRGRRITVTGKDIRVDDKTRTRSIAMESAALATLPRLGETEGGPQMRRVAQLFESFRVFDPNVDAARQPSAQTIGDWELATDARNLASFLVWLKREYEEVFELLVDDMKAIVPGLDNVRVEVVGGSTQAAKVVLQERGLKGTTDLAYASFGTIRALAILAMLHEPSPAPLRCVEELDHGLHPHALDRLVDRLRDASRRGQIIVATHSPALVNRLHPEELIICERDSETGASRIPAITQDDVRRIMYAGDLGLGELWFSGVLGGNP